MVKKDGRDGRSLPTYDVLQGTGENRKLLASVLYKKKWPKIDTGDPKQGKERIDLYFDYCCENDMRPTASGLASSLGISRTALWKWKQGIDRPNNFPIIEEAYNTLEELWELYMITGKINPPNGIFLGKNQFGYKDVQDVIITPNNPLGDTRNAEEIAEQYSFLPEE